MFGRKFLKAFGWFWIWELINYIVGVLLSVFLGSVYRAIITTLIFTVVVFRIIYSRRSAKFENKKNYLDQNPPQSATSRSILSTALRSPEYVPEIFATAPVMLLTGIYWGAWLLASGLTLGQKSFVVLLAFTVGTVGFAILDLLNRYLVYRNWVRDYLDTVNGR